MNTDLISRADAEALFRTARSKLNPSDYKTADEFNTRDLMLLNAEQMIHLLPSVTPQEPKTSNSENPNKWIPVSERLPEENGYYLTTTMYHEVYCDYWEEERFNRTEAVIAWMPLPEPYKAESEEQA